MEIKDGTSIFDSFDVVKEAVGRVDKVLQIVEDILVNAYQADKLETKQDLIENAKLILQDAREQLK
ncbi:hypothetical protein [Gottfriedia acidiceleris]|uniref:Uncharacterized protein n=1 Tax=Gottfriedia acidiceleris TaxID=371036 RepID=A0ABY4JQW3_9BACI|nr:hypothetical protein [Gottfriedia acidiceleris]UPM56218.1 hypothetical protein MY490_10450 [Gottfriedia acidiceleris]